jgi:hypothetical protein
VSGREKPEDKSGGLSRVARRALETAADAAAGLPGDIAYQHTVWCQTSLPYRNPPAAVRVWEKRQGNVSLRVEAGAAQAPDRPEWIELPLPFGPKARLILCYLNAEAIRQQTPVIGVRDSLTAFVKRLGLAGNGRNITAVKCQLTALSAAVIRFGFLREHCSVTVKQDIVQGFDLWFPRDGRQRILWPSAVRLSDHYFDSLVRHAVPLDERALGALAHSAMALDIYSWLAQRLHRIPKSRPQRIPWVAVQQQFGDGYGRADKFRAVFRVAMRQVLTQYPAARAEEDGQGLVLRNSAPPVPGRLPDRP